MKKRPTLKDTFPPLVAEIEQGLIESGEWEVARGVYDLEIHECCACDESSCTSFYTAPKPKEKDGYGAGHRNIMLNPKAGMLILDVVDDDVVFVEVLERQDLQKPFQKLRKKLEKKQ